MTHTVLVTGATGYLGKHLVPRLRDLGFDVHISNTTQANLLEIENLNVFDDQKFDYIFHLAALAKAGDYCLTHSGEQWEVNQIINSNILKYWCKHQPQAKIICMGTSCSYAVDAHLMDDGLCENNYLLGEPEEGLYTYAMTKRMLLVGLKAYQKQYGLKWSYFIPSTLYGPNFDINDTHFIFDLIKKIYAGKYHNAKVELWGDGFQRRELVYIDDAVDAMIKLLNVDNKIFNIGSGQDYSIRDFAQKLCYIFEYEHDKISYDISKYVGVREKRLNVEKVKKYIPNMDWTSLDDGIKKAVEYYVKEKSTSNWR